MVFACKGSMSLGRPASPASTWCSMRWIGGTMSTIKWKPVDGASPAKLGGRWYAEAISGMRFADLVFASFHYDIAVSWQSAKNSQAGTQCILRHPKAPSEQLVESHPVLVREFLSVAMSSSESGTDVWSALLLQDAVRERATDIHIDPHADGARNRLRIDGVVRDAAHVPVEVAQQLINQMKVLARLHVVEDTYKTFSITIFSK